MGLHNYSKYIKSINVILLIILQFTIFYSCYGQQNNVNFDTALKNYKENPNPDERIYTCFALADYYMDIERLDSSQYWLNNIYALKKIEPVSLFNYLCITRQSEIYYYDNLPNLGLQSAWKSKKIAEELKDSILIGDACNFVGLFYIMKDSFPQAIQHLRRALQHSKIPPIESKYINVTKPLHILGNIAEAYEKNNQLDSAQKYSFLSLREAEKIKRHRGCAVAWQSIGKIYFKKNKLDSAVYAFNQSIIICDSHKILDVKLLNYSGLAKVSIKLGKEELARKYLKNGFDYIEEQGVINILFTKEFIKEAINIYKNTNQIKLLNVAYSKMYITDSMSSSYNSIQLEQIVTNNSTAENKILKYEISTANHGKQRITLLFTSLALALLLVILAIIYSRYRLKQKLKIAQLQNRISSDLHDNLGATLSSVKIYSELAQKTGVQQFDQTDKILNKIKLLSHNAIEEINTLVWAIKPNEENTLDFESKIKNIGGDLLGAKDIECNYALDLDVLNNINSIEIKKNILNIIKESFNNIAKYSHASHVSITLHQENSKIKLEIIDNGVGFDLKNISNGNGLKNIKMRAEQLHGTSAIQSAPDQGCTITVEIPVKDS